MKAAFNTEPITFEIRDVPELEAQSGEALVRVKACGICGSDKNEFGKNKKPPRIAGHEFSGLIEKISGDPGDFRAGDRVICSPYTPSGTIGYARPGAFAEYCVVPVESLLAMPEGLSFPEASLAEPLAVALHAATRTQVSGKSCCVFGAGTIGMLTALCCKAKGAREIWIVDLDRRHLGIASSLGLRAVDSSEGFTQLPSAGFDVTFECVGHADALLDAALEMARKQGEVVFVGADHPKGIPTRTLVYKALTLYGSFGISMAELREAVDLMVTGRVPVKKIITARFPLIKMNDAFAASLTSQKIIVEP